eukprot:TRINITY_DN17720_c1_g1_i2.p2 TRINITY_DN17720_c1_g1~~TRINITY_DN17720_c1_g1_i2.p2  ORF type:complete len:317 (+),score=80.00 TRINITY_DN17720_c1_g1_i2:76-951(+)
MTPPRPEPPSLRSVWATSGALRAPVVGFLDARSVCVAGRLDRRWREAVETPQVWTLLVAADFFGIPPEAAAQHVLPGQLLCLGGSTPRDLYRRLSLLRREEGRNPWLGRGRSEALATVYTLAPRVPLGEGGLHMCVLQHQHALVDWHLRQAAGRGDAAAALLSRAGGGRRGRGRRARGLTALHVAALCGDARSARALLAAARAAGCAHALLTAAAPAGAASALAARQGHSALAAELAAAARQGSLDTLFVKARERGRQLRRSLTRERDGSASSLSRSRSRSCSCSRVPAPP